MLLESGSATRRAIPIRSGSATLLVSMNQLKYEQHIENLIYIYVDLVRRGRRR
jgi:hypothetical protein